MNVHKLDTDTEKKIKFESNHPQSLSCNDIKSVDEETKEKLNIMPLLRRKTVVETNFDEEKENNVS